MNQNRVISTAVLFLLLGTIIPAFAQKGQEEKGGDGGKAQQGQPQRTQPVEHQQEPQRAKSVAYNGGTNDLDTGIEKNLDAALITNRLHKGVKLDVKNGVVTLTGEVKSKTERVRTEKVASSVPNVKQVVNELEVKNQKATSSK